MRIGITEKDVEETMDPDTKKLRVHAEAKLYGETELPIWANDKNVTVGCNNITCEVFVDNKFNTFLHLR